MRRNRDLAEAANQAQAYARRTAARVRYGDAAGLLQVDAERTLATARLARVQSDMALAQAEVTLFRALGGGWRGGAQAR
jgi:outer membrane protein TolC